MNPYAKEIVLRSILAYQDQTPIEKKKHYKRVQDQLVLRKDHFEGSFVLAAKVFLRIFKAENETI